MPRSASTRARVLARARAIRSPWVRPISLGRADRDDANNNTFPAALRFLTRREWEWNLTDQASYLAVKRSNDLTTATLRHRIWQSTEAPYDVTGVHAGAPSEVHPHTLAALHRQQLTEVQGQADVAIFGLPLPAPTTSTQS